MMIFSMMLLALGAPEKAAPQSADLSEPGMPATNPGSWATNDDYPPRAMRDEREGTTGFKLHYGSDGLPTACEIISPSGQADLDQLTCKLVMERARFTPGRNARGEKVGGTYSNRIRWQIPDGYIEKLASAGFSVDEARESWPRGPSPLPAMLLIEAAPHYPAAARAAREEGDVHMAVSVDALGKVTGCSVIDGSLSPELDRAACKLMLSEGQFKPALDSAGKPIKGVVPAVFRWVLPREDTAGNDAVPPPRTLRKFPMGEPGVTTMSVLIDVDGKASGCHFSGPDSNSGNPAPRMNPCDGVGGEQRYIPFADANGKPVARRITYRTELKVEDQAAPE
ncbi:TonB family protein [Sphingopyxis panaciterrae]